jgi:hypothetical protein
MSKAPFSNVRVCESITTLYVCVYFFVGCAAGSGASGFKYLIEWRTSVNIRTLAAATLLLASAGAASAQPYQDPGTPPPPAAPVAPPPDGTLSTTHEVHAVDAYGNRLDKKESTYRNSNGVAQDSQTTTSTVPAPPPPPPVTSSTTTSTTTSTVPQ